MVEHVLLRGNLVLLELLLLDSFMNIEEKYDDNWNQRNHSSANSNHNDELNWTLVSYENQIPRSSPRCRAYANILD